MERQRELRYFVWIKLGMIITVTVYAALFVRNEAAGITYQTLCLTALLFMAVVWLELKEEKREREALEITDAKAPLAVINSLLPLAAELVFAAVLIGGLDRDYIYLLPMVILDIFVIFRRKAFSYMSVYLGLLLTNEKVAYFAIASFTVILYYQHYNIVKEEQIKSELSEGKEEELKRNLSRSEIRYHKELDRNRLYYDNKILEERTRLSQALHDKLGHSINGSVYQLEAVKVLFEKNSEESKVMLQAVIDNLRSSMEEIRYLLRQERPDKKQLAFIQLNSLCEDCKRKYGIEAEFSLTGAGEEIGEKYWEIILDNCFEAVSNALKYSYCTRINIEILVMNRIVRCTISDNGKGCLDVKTGMGLEGMRRRVREVNGFISFSGEDGFVINMLLPLEGS